MGSNKILEIYLCWCSFIQMQFTSILFISKKKIDIYIVVVLVVVVVLVKNAANFHNLNIFNSLPKFFNIHYCVNFIFVVDIEVAIVVIASFHYYSINILIIKNYTWIRFFFTILNSFINNLFSFFDEFLSDLVWLFLLWDFNFKKLNIELNWK